MNHKNHILSKIIQKNNDDPLNNNTLRQRINDLVFSKPTKDATKDNSEIDVNNAKNKISLIKFIQKNNSKILEDFEVLDYINSGSVGVFYNGNYKKINKKKIGMKFYLNLKNKRKNEEINFMKKLKHKNVIGLYAYLKINDNNTCAILEMAKYGDLGNFQNKYLHKRHLSETLLCYFTKQLLDALKYIHNSKVLHSDIKQDNILIDSYLNVKLTDFSCSSSYENIDPNSEINFPFAGTGKFIAPEILEKKKILVKNANKIDIYSMGVMLYYLAFGIYPYDLESVKSRDYEMISKTIKNQKKLIFQKDIKISGIFENFLERSLEIDINKRLDIENALKHPWVLGANIIMNEKEKISSLQKFLVKLVKDDIMEFNDYIKCEDKEKRKQMIEY